MSLLNTIRIFLWLKIKETWKYLLGVLAYIIVLSLGVICQHMYPLITFIVCCAVILVIIICAFIAITIPWLKQNWQKAKKILEMEGKK